MIAQGKAIAHGSVSINYITRLGKAETVKLNHLPSDVEVQALWAHMKAHQLLHRNRRSNGHPLKNDMIRIEISPERDDTQGWTIGQWRELLDQFVSAFDSADSDSRDRRFRGHRCRLADSQYIATLHRDSKSGIVHMHLDCNRVDMDGNLNDDYRIGERAALAANRVTEARGWVLAEQRSAENRERISQDCIAVLKDMDRFDWDDYAVRLSARGYDLRMQTDSEGKVRGYSVRMGNSIYKSSVLGHGRNLMPSRIGQTWRLLHPHGQEENVQKDNSTQRATENTEPDTYILTMTVDEGKDRFRIRIPEAALAEIGRESLQMGLDKDSDIFSYTMKTAVLLFAGMIDEATSIAESFGGGGSAPSSGWGRNKDEDDLEWAHRCARKAHEMVTAKRIRTYRR